MESRDLAREPCPDRIVEDLGGAFGMGCIGGFLWHFGKGFHNSPRGERLLGGFYSARMRAPILGGNFAVWGGTFSAFDCLFQHLRRKDDPWNAIASGAATGGTLALRGGWRNAGRQAVVGGILLAVIEGVMVVFSRRTASTPRDQYYQALKMEEQAQRRKEAAAAAAAKKPSVQGAWFPFGKHKTTSQSGTTASLSSFETAETATGLSETLVTPTSSFSQEYAPPIVAESRSWWRR